MEIMLTDQELTTLNILASFRTLVARANKINDTKISKSPTIEVELDGIIGEYAFCKINNIFMAELVASPRAAGADCVYRGKKIDIKSTRHIKGKLLGIERRNMDIDVYVLCVIQGYNVTFPGWLYSEELYHPSNKTRLSGVDVFAVEQKDLRKWN
jgi:hypothetical protein